jgi:hypothetical protein
MGGAETIVGKLKSGHGSRMTKQPIKIRNEDLSGLVSCSGEGFDVRMNLATRLRRSAENFVRCHA